MDNTDLILIEQWKDIPLPTKYRYQASTIGRISHLYPSGERVVLSECYIKTLSGYATGLVMADGHCQKFQTISLIAKTWLGVRDSSWQAIHKNGIRSDHRVANIQYIKRGEIGTIANRKKRKAVLKINSDGEAIEVYASARECAEKNHFCYASIKRRCHGDFKTVLASDGFAYCYEDDEKYLQKILRELEKHGKGK